MDLGNETIAKQLCITTEEDNYHQPLPIPPQSPNYLNYKRRLSHDDDGPTVPKKKFKADELHCRIAIVIPIMANRFQYIITTYSNWKRNGFDIVLVFNKEEEGAITNILQQHSPDIMASFIKHPYTTSNCPNAGIAKNEAYKMVQQYIDLPNFKFSVLLDDTVNDIINTKTDKSIMTNPFEFYHAVVRFAEESPIFGGTVAAKRHPNSHEQEGTRTVSRGFLQQALIFSCRGMPTLTKHFKDVDNYVKMMRRLSYRGVPFGEDVSFQVALYEHGVIPQGKSAQFWGLGITRIKHKSATKRQFHQLDDAAKEALKDMLIYLREQGALTINPVTKELSGVKVIPGQHKCFTIRGTQGERPWRETYIYTFPCSKENSKDLINRLCP